MNPFDKLETSALSANTATMPPVENWNPSLSGEIDIVIKSNGDWYHEGIKFTRQPLVKLFASILRKEGRDYYLVTPVEKWRITVEELPLLITDMDVLENVSDKTHQSIWLKTSTDDIFHLDGEHPLHLTHNKHGELRPSILVRAHLEALIHRNVFYRLANIAENVDGVLGVWSNGAFFKLE